MRATAGDGRSWPGLGLRLIDRCLGRWAKAVLVTRFGPTEAGRLVRRAVVRSRQPAVRPGNEPGAGGKLMTHAAALTASLYHELSAVGLSSTEARRVTAEATSAIYRRMGRVPWLIARLTARSPERRLRRAIAAFRRFPFGPPAYRMRDLPLVPDAVAFDVERCPVAEYFRERGLGDLCVESWCNLDYALAKDWGARLDREKTIAGGDTRCDFRWNIGSGSSPE